MAGPVENELLPQIRQHALHLVDQFGADQPGNDAILRSRDEQRWLVDLGALPRRGQFPIAVDVAIPVEPAAKTGLSVDVREIGDVGLGQPIRQRPIWIGAGEESLALLNILMGRRIGEPASAQNDSHRRGDIALELGFSHARRLKILPVEIGDAVVPQGFERQAASAGGGWNAEARDLGEDIGPEHRRVPGDRRAPVMADNDGLLFAKRRHQRDHVADIVEDGVGADVGGRAGPAEPAHIGGDDMETGFRDGSDLVPPGIG